MRHREKRNFKKSFTSTLKSIREFFNIFFYVICNKLWYKHSKKIDVDFIRLKSFWYSCDVYPIYFPANKIRFPVTLFNKTIDLTYPISWIFSYITYFDIIHGIKKHRIIYLDLNFANFFISHVIGKIKYPFVLVSWWSDFSTSKYKSILKNQYLIKRFAQNNDINSKKIESIPIWLDYHSLCFIDKFWQWITSPVEQEKELKKIIALSDWERKFQVFSNFHLNITSPRRQDIYDKMKNKNIIFFQKTRLSRLKTWELQSKFNFVYSPRWFWRDCHRTWEALLLWCIPIVDHSPLDNLHEEFPIVIINNTDDITEENLHIWYNKYKNSFNDSLKKKLTNKYWIGKILNST